MLLKNSHLAHSLSELLVLAAPDDAWDPPTMKEIFTSFGIALRQLQVWLVAGGGAIASAPLFVFGSLWGIPYLM